MALNKVLSSGIEKRDRATVLSNGIEQRNKEIIGKMLSKGLPIEQISELTGISIDKITQISKNLK